MATKENFEAKVTELWNRVQSNEESLEERKNILNESDELMANPDFLSNPFLVSKLKLIMHKAGKPTDLAALATEFEGFAKLQPSTDVWICLAETYLHQGKADAAVSPLEFAQALGENVDVLILLSLCYRRIEKKDTKKSLDYAKQAVKLDLKNGKAWGNLGIALLSEAGHENIVQASKAFKCAINNGQQNNADVLMNLGTVYELLLNFMEAMRCYEEAIRIAGKWQVALDSLGRLQTRLSNVISRSEAIPKIRPAKKAKMLERVKDDDEYLFVEAPFSNDDPSQIILCMNKATEVFAFGIIKTMRAYIIPEKSVLKLKVPEFSNLEINGKTIKYYIIDDQRKVKITHGATPANVSPVSISSTIA
ncbi:hypothetical protein M9Y10_042432 [Tritrichomonas musculus]|uniref:TPR Domain containing protein n=1 Tax=Tritrichomonas musculus TaxID=1915356 RepID=A0ABR2GPF4_9EUKA